MIEILTQLSHKALQLFLTVSGVHICGFTNLVLASLTGRTLATITGLDSNPLRGFVGGLKALVSLAFLIV